MYADDMILMSESQEGLQKMLSSLEKYTKEWNLSVNVEKTKVMIFRNGGKVRKEETWYYEGCKLDVVNEFKYLGMLLNYNGKFLKTQKHAAEQGRKAFYAPFATLKPCVNFLIHM